jgi:MarR family transcriptional regulator, organic hydroperoxide resistance regulator
MMVKSSTAASRQSTMVQRTDLADDAGLDYPELIKRFLWDIASINVRLDQIRAVWAAKLEITGPQWMILMAVRDLDSGQGISVKDVSALLHVGPSFVTTHSKILETKNLVRRVSSSDDARVVLMSLTDKASKKIAALSDRRDEIVDFVFSSLAEPSLRDTTDNLAKVKQHLEKAIRMLAVDS